MIELFAPRIPGLLSARSHCAGVSELPPQSLSVGHSAGSLGFNLRGLKLLLLVPSHFC